MRYCKIRNFNNFYHKELFYLDEKIKIICPIRQKQIDKIKKMARRVTNKTAEQMLNMIHNHINCDFYTHRCARIRWENL